MSQDLSINFGWPHCTTSVIPGLSVVVAHTSAVVGESAALVKGASYLLCSTQPCFVRFGATGATPSAADHHLFLPAGTPWPVRVPTFDAATAVHVCAISADESGSLTITRMSQAIE